MENIITNTASVIIKDFQVEQYMSNHSAGSLSKSSLKRISRNAAQEVSDNTDENKGSEGSREYLQSSEGIQDQFHALIVEVKSGFMSQDEKMADLVKAVKRQALISDQSITSIKSALENLATLVKNLALEFKTQPSKKSCTTRDSYNDSLEGDFISGEGFERDEIIVPGDGEVLDPESLSFSSQVPQASVPDSSVPADPRVRVELSFPLLFPRPPPEPPPPTILLPFPTILFPFPTITPPSIIFQPPTIPHFIFHLILRHRLRHLNVC